MDERTDRQLDEWMKTKRPVQGEPHLHPTVYGIGGWMNGELNTIYHQLHFAKTTLAEVFLLSSW